MKKNTSFQHYTNIRRFVKIFPQKFRNKKVFLTLPTINNIIKLC